jgi:hypothetical protein
VTVSSANKARVPNAASLANLKGNAGKGRVKGVPNRVTADVKALAQVHTAKAITTLADIMANGESDAARVSAANSLLDRGHGKPKQALIGGDADDTPLVPATFRPTPAATREALVACNNAV